MNAFEKFVEFLSMEMPSQQGPFGWFHFLMQSQMHDSKPVISATLSPCPNQASLLAQTIKEIQVENTWLLGRKE